MIITFAWAWMTHGYVSVVRILKMLTIIFSNVGNTKVSDEFCYNLCKISCQTAYIVSRRSWTVSLLLSPWLYEDISVNQRSQILAATFQFIRLSARRLWAILFCSFPFTYMKLWKIKKRNSATTFPELIIPQWQRTCSVFSAATYQWWVLMFSNIHFFLGPLPIGTPFHWLFVSCSRLSPSTGLCCTRHLPTVADNHDSGNGWSAPIAGYLTEEAMSVNSRVFGAWKPYQNYNSSCPSTGIGLHKLIA